MWFVAIAVQVLLPVFFFNSLGFSAFLYVGCLCIAVFLILSFLAQNRFNKKGGIPQGKNCMYTTNLVNDGVYSVVRHPMYTGWILLMFSFSFFSQHWLSVVLGLITAALIYRQAANEDKMLVQKFGTEYYAYMKAVPRVNIIGGLFSWLRKSK
jgi:protein-S-isoprenylcysteine O-methyltransferase Ste14